MPEITTYNAVPDEPAVQRAWDALLATMSESPVFYTHQWARAVAGHLLVQPMVLVAKEGGQVVGIGAFAQLSKRSVGWLAHGTADYCDVLAAPGSQPLVLNAFLRELRRQGIDEVVLTNVPEHSPTVPAVHEAAKTAGFRVVGLVVGDCPVVRLGTGEARSALHKELTRKRRLKEKLSALRKLGSVELDCWRDAGALRAALPGFVRAHTERFEASGRQGPYSDPDKQQFLTSALEALAATGEARMFRLRLDETPLAWAIVFVTGKRWLWYMPTFAASHTRFSPGLLLLRMVIEAALADDQAEIVDLGMGDEDYKTRFANGVEHIRGYILTTSAARYAYLSARGVAARGLRRFPRLHGLVRSIVRRKPGS